jgi:hypothetical protein
MLFGLPDTTFFAVSGATALILLALFLWGLTFRGADI